MTGLAKSLARTLVPRGIRNWLRSPFKSASWIWDEIKHSIGSDQVVQMRPGWSLLCHPAAYRFAYCSQLDDPEQAAEFDSFISRCRPRMVLFDIGAHFGIFSFAALHFGGAGALAVAVDPSPAAIKILKVQARLNKVGGRLRMLEASVGEREGEDLMVAGGVLSHGYFLTPSQDHSAAELTKTRVTTLDGLARTFDISPTHVKIDVEGAEAAVLKGGRNILSQKTGPILFIELHNEMIRARNGDPEDTLDILKGFGYTIASGDGVTLDKTSVLRRPLLRIVARKEK